MIRAWLDEAGAARFELKAGLTMLGGARADLRVASGADSLHLWSQPPKLIFVGGGALPRVNGREVQEVDLRHSDRIEWCGRVWTFGFDDGQAQLEELSPERPTVATGARGAADGRADPTWRRLKAGLVAELALADRAVTRRWQDAVARGEFDSEAASRELLAAASTVADDDPRLLERSTRLMRDLLMSSVTRSPMRAMRRGARSGLAFLVAQVLILALFCLLFLAALLLLRTRFGHSIDAFLDRIVNAF